MAFEDESIESVVFAGGGDAGLLGALLLREHNPEIDITIVDDFNEDPPAVGKSTFAYIKTALHNTLGIEMGELIKEVKPVWKLSVWFQDWGGSSFHVPFDTKHLRLLEGTSRGYEEYYRYHEQQFKTIGATLAEHQRTPFRRESEPNEVPSMYAHTAYHFSLNRFHSFLETLCEDRGIELVNDCITSVETKDNWITSIASDSTVYTADLYVDSTGFNRTLMSELENEFQDFDFYMDTALVTNHEIGLEEIVPATVVTTGDNGWFWQIDTTDSRDLGYVFSSTHTTKDEAIEEFATEFPNARISEETVNTYGYSAGAYEKAWVNNCLALGTAGGFVEPLQSLGLSSYALFASKFSELLKSNFQVNRQGIRSTYNSLVSNSWEEIYEFLRIHYQYTTGETQFWTDMRDLYDSHSFYYDRYQEIGAHSIDKAKYGYGHQGYFLSYNLAYTVLQGLNVESALYEDTEVNVPNQVKQDIEQQRERINQEPSTALTYPEFYEQKYPQLFRERAP